MSLSKNLLNQKLGLAYLSDAFETAGLDNVAHPNKRIRKYKFDVINLGTFKNIIPTAVLKKTLYNDIVFSRKKQKSFENIVIKNDQKIYETISELAHNFYGDYTYFAPYKIRFETLNTSFFKQRLEAKETILKNIDKNLPFARLQFPPDLSNTSILSGAKSTYTLSNVQNNIITTDFYITGYLSGINYNNRNTFLYKEFENVFQTKNLKLSIEYMGEGSSELVSYLNNQIFYPTTSNDVTLGGTDFETNTPILYITGLGFNVQPTGLPITTPTKWSLRKRRAGGGTLGAFYWDLEQLISYPGTCNPNSTCVLRTPIASRLYTSSALGPIPPTSDASVPSGQLGAINDWVSSYGINFDFASGSLSGYLPYPNSATLWQYPVFNLNTVIALDSVYTYPEMYKDMNGLLIASLRESTGIEKIVYVSPHTVQNKFVNTIVDNLDLRLSRLQPKVVGRPPRFEYIQVNSGITINILDISSEYLTSGTNVFETGVVSSPSVNSLKLSITANSWGDTGIANYLNNKVFYSVPGGYETDTPTYTVTLPNGVEWWTTQGRSYISGAIASAPWTSTKWVLKRRSAGGGTLAAFYWYLAGTINVPGSCGTGLCLIEKEIATRLYTNGSHSSIAPTRDATVPSGSPGIIDSWQTYRSVPPYNQNVLSYNIDFDRVNNPPYSIQNVLKQTTPLKDTWFYKFYSGLYTNNKTIATGTWDGVIPSGYSVTLEYIATKDSRVGTDNEFRFFYEDYGDNSYIDQSIRNNFITSEPVLKRGFGISDNLIKSIELSNTNLRKGINTTYSQFRKELPSGVNIFPENAKIRKFRNLYTTNNYDYLSVDDIPSGVYGCFKLSNKQIVCIDPPNLM